MFSKIRRERMNVLLSTTILPASDEDEVLWIQILPAAEAVYIHDRSQRDCDVTSGHCDLNSMYNMTNADEYACPNDPENVHEQIKQKVLIPLTALILLTNLVVLFFIIANKRFHTPTYIFIGSLVIADLFVGFVSIVTVTTKANEKDQIHCLARIGFTVAAISASTWSLTCVAADRYIAVKRALKYTTIMTKRKTFMGIAWSWTFSLIIGFLPIMGWKDNYNSYKYYCSFMYVLPNYYIISIFTVSAVIPIGIMCAVYIILFKTSRFHIKQIQNIEKLYSNDKRNSSIFGISTRTLRSVKTFAAVLGCVVITWSPFLIATTVQIAQANKHCTLQEVIGTHLLVLGFSNSFLNPLIYAIGTKDFRKKVSQLFRRRCYVKNSSQVFPSEDK